MNWFKRNDGPRVCARGPWRAGGHVESSTDQQLPALTAGAPSQKVGAVTLVGAMSRKLPWGLELALGVQNVGEVHLADVSPLFAGG